MTTQTCGSSCKLLRTCLVSFKNYLQEGQYNHLKTAVKGAFT
ncbi:poly(glycerol-phosphate) alpha-glucosyltransferase, partial [Lacticaseibacillus paracasei]|nr:poly(glycerol-phosphate) alpha-glucosyltransferase [Lacticaseibacillus paracasei]MCT3368002.1 poly(glycerol-phosphate) alpha-glucosyltransferase [Lacticaseibacillus paracasei]MCT3375492.1 poly(glycerol-phosphate) alpha-glucosyltransferase [Lacticaseibacillus paracasei]